MNSISANVSNITANVTADLAEMSRKEKELKEATAQLKALEALQAKDTELQGENPQYISGSLRKATAEDVETFTSRGVVCHGRVGDITCKGCGKTHVLNVQDLAGSETKAPSVYCPECKKVASKEKGKFKRAQKRLNGKSLEQLTAEIAEIEAKKAELNARLGK